MRIVVVLHMVLILGVGAVPTWAGEVKTDKTKLQGLWAATTVVEKGNPFPTERAKMVKLVFQDDKCTYHVGKVNYAATYKIDSTRKPRTIDITFEEGPKRGLTMKAIYSLDGDDLKICGGTERPKDFKSTKDGGSVLFALKREYMPLGRWYLQESGIEDDLLAVTFVDEKIGWAVGKESTILATIDGGKKWKRQIPRKLDGPEFHAVLFTSPKFGWVKTHVAGTILHTIDGGENWKQIPLPPGVDPDEESFTKHAAVGSTYFFQADERLFKTDDGKTWIELTKKFPADGEQIGGMWFADLKNGIASWNGGGYAVTSDGGKTWKADRLKAMWAEGKFMLPFAIDAKIAWLVPEKGKLAATTDGGATWNPQDVGESAALIGAHFLDAKVGHVLLDRGGEVGEVRRTVDAGKTWRTLGTCRNPGELGGVSFPSRRFGWVVGAKGYIEHYQEPPEK